MVRKTGEAEESLKQTGQFEMDPIKNVLKEFKEKHDKIKV